MRAKALDSVQFAGGPSIHYVLIGHEEDIQVVDGIPSVKPVIEITLYAREAKELYDEIKVIIEDSGGGEAAAFRGEAVTIRVLARVMIFCVQILATNVLTAAIELLSQAEIENYRVIADPYSYLSLREAVEIQTNEVYGPAYRIPKMED